MLLNHTNANEARRAFTLVELVVVIAILVVVAGIVVGRLDSVLSGVDGPTGAMATATRTTLTNVRDAMTGVPESAGFDQDLGELPARVVDLFLAPNFLPSRKPVVGTPLEHFDRVHSRGWNGPYITRFTGYYHVDSTQGFLARYSEEHDRAVLDAWGSPIVLQIPDLPPPATLDERFQFARLVSAGADKTIVTDPDVRAPDVNDVGAVGDDVVLYLYRANGP